MSDTASLYSTTDTLVDVPTLNGTQRGLLPPSECFVVLLVHHDHYKADVEQLTRAGLPSSYDRISQPSTSRAGLGKLNMRKRLQVQIPRSVIQRAKIDRKSHLTSLEGVSKMREDGKKNKAGKRMTLFDALEDDLVGVQSRETLDIIVGMLFQGSDLHSPTMYYPAQSVLATPRWAVCKGGQFASASAQWATLSFVSPAQINTEGEEKSEGVKRYLDTIKEGESDEQVLERLVPPTEKSQELLQSLLSHLESRGAIWTRAGHVTKPSIKNAKPRDRPEFVVLGLFPEPFVGRCQTYYKNGRAMSADFKEDAKSKYAPLITSSTYGEQIKSHGKVTGTDGAAPKVDFLEDWFVRIATLEPFRTGSPWEDSSASMLAGGSMAGAF